MLPLNFKKNIYPSRRPEGFLAWLWGSVNTDRPDLVIVHGCPVSHKDSGAWSPTSLGISVLWFMVQCEYAHRETRAGISCTDLCCYDFTNLIGFHQLFTKWVRSGSVLPYLVFLKMVIRQLNWRMFAAPKGSNSITKLLQSSFILINTSSSLKKLSISHGQCFRPFPQSPDINLLL